MSFHKLTLAELQQKFTAGEVTASDIARAYCLRIGQVEPKVRAYCDQCKQATMDQAEALDANSRGGARRFP